VVISLIPLFTCLAIAASAAARQIFIDSTA